MTLADDLAMANLSKRTSGGKCRICQFLKTLDKKSLEAISEKIKDVDNVQSSTLAKFLTEKGYVDVSQGIVSRHRRGDCKGAK